MAHSSSTSGFIVLRAGLGCLLLGLLGAAILTGDSTAQAPDPKGAKDEKTPQTDRKRVEEEEDSKTPKRKVIRVEDEEKNPKTTDRPESAPVVDLAQAARQTKHPAVKELFQTLAVPHDVVILKAFPNIEQQSRERRINVQPIPQFIGDNPKGLANKIEVQPFDNEWRLKKSESYSPGTIRSVQPYEWVARDAVKGFLDNDFEKLAPVNNRYLSSEKKNYYAGQALAAVLRFHESARRIGTRSGEGWDRVETDLRQQLLTIALNELQELTKEKNWDAAFEMARRLSETYPDPGDQGRIVQPLTKLLQEELDGRNFSGDKLREVRERLRQVARQFPDNNSVERINKLLRQQAEYLFAEAKKEKDPAREQDLLKEAEETWPDLPELRTYRIVRGNAHPILKVGVRELPEYLSPGMACTDTELRAVDLLFESLVKARPYAGGFVRYLPGLAEGRPSVTTLGREFQLPANARWSNGKPVTVGDFHHTLRQWRLGRGTGLSAAWSDLFAERDEVASVGDPPRITLHLRQGCPDPLALMTFKIIPQPANVPASLRRADANEIAEEAFARNPIGSGPYWFKADQKSDDKGRPCRVFLANFRSGRSVQPSIQEIHFYAPGDPVKELENGSLDLILDLYPEQVARLKDLKERGKVILAPPTSLNHRIYFLAVNHRIPKLQNTAVRRALAYAINREQLLDEHFRKGLGDGYHQALNGPYPARSWATNPALPKAYDPDLARGLLTQETKDTPRTITLSLKYPAGDEVLDRAMKALAEQVKQNTNDAILLQLQSLDPHKLREDVEGTHDYELAYYHYDFPDDTFWLGPLLGQRALPQGGNYLGYQGDLSMRIQNSLSYRNPSELKQAARNTHEKLSAEMPLIPLWQLDPLIAWQAHVKPEPFPFDPWRVFGDIETWRLDRH
jgi:ABC-type oligopeptide transport system substrate-binding subunit